MRDPTPQDVKNALMLLRSLANNEDQALTPLEAEALLRHIRTLYIKGFNFGLRSIIHAMDLARDQARAGDQLIDEESVPVERDVGPQ